VTGFPVRQVRTIHGYRRAFVTAGSGPALLLLHGIGERGQTWEPVLERLARTHTVVVPDLLGHGESDKPRADYSMGGYANGMRDLLSVLDIERVSVIGHSLGGGVAQQFAYQYPERCERLILVGSGGLGRSVHPVLRAASIPGAEAMLGVLTSAPVRLAVDGELAGLAALTGTLGALPAGPDPRVVARAVSTVAELRRVWEGVSALHGRDARAAFVRTLRSVVDRGGQVVTGLDRLYLLHAMPLLMVWGERDRIIPVAHARRLHGMLSASRLEVFPTAGHWPHHTDPERFCDVVLDFCATTQPAAHDRDSWRGLLAQGSGREALDPDPQTRRRSLRRTAATAPAAAPVRRHAG
jgi:pimeloyl-ACP methyl ester carboxylesterase